MLGRAVGGDAGHPPFPACEATLTMCPGRVAGMRFEGELGTGDRSVQVDVDLAAESLVLLVDRRHRHDPGVVDHDIERAELALGGLIEEGGEGGAAGDVELRARAVPPPRLLSGLLG